MLRFANTVTYAATEGLLAVATVGPKFKVPGGAAIETITETGDASRKETLHALMVSAIQGSRDQFPNIPATGDFGVVIQGMPPGAKEVAALLSPNRGFVLSIGNSLAREMCGTIIAVAGNAHIMSIQLGTPVQPSGNVLLEVTIGESEITARELDPMNPQGQELRVFQAKVGVRKK